MCGDVGRGLPCGACVVLAPVGHCAVRPLDEGQHGIGRPSVADIVHVGHFGCSGRCGWHLSSVVRYLYPANHRAQGLVWPYAPGAQAAHHIGVPAVGDIDVSALLRRNSVYAEPIYLERGRLWI